MTNYQELVKAQEFLKFLRNQDLILSHEGLHDLALLDCSEEVKRVKNRLSCGARLLISNSKRKPIMGARDSLVSFLAKEAAHFLDGSTMEVEILREKIRQCLEQEEKSMRNASAESECIEIDFYVRGLADALPPVRPLTLTTAGVQNSIIPMALGVPDHSYQHCGSREQKEVINIGEAASKSKKDTLPKKLAQLERAVCYVCVKEDNENVEEVIGYAAIGMSIINGAQLASSMISLNEGIFPNLAKLLRVGRLAYLFSERSKFGDIECLLDHYDAIERHMKKLEDTVTKLRKMCIITMGFMVLLLGLAWSCFFWTITWRSS